jgi:hypothetical protein
LFGAKQSKSPSFPKVPRLLPAGTGLIGPACSRQESRSYRNYERQNVGSSSPQPTYFSNFLKKVLECSEINPLLKNCHSALDAESSLFTPLDSRLRENDIKGTQIKSCHCEGRLFGAQQSLFFVLTSTLLPSAL